MTAEDAADRVGVLLLDRGDIEAELEARAQQEIEKRKLEAEAKLREQAKKGLNSLFGKPKPAPATPASPSASASTRSVAPSRSG